MKRKNINLLTLIALTAMSFAMLAAPTWGQNGGPTPKTNTRILYHGGPIMSGTSTVYVIWYGNWTTSSPGNNGWTRDVLTEMLSNIGSSPYFRINTLYTDSAVSSPNGALIYAGAVDDVYSRGSTLTVSDIQGVVAQMIESGALPLDTTGIYVVLASSDVTDIRPDGSMYCFPPPSRPHHGVAGVFGTVVKYAFIGNAARCPTSAAPQFFGPGGTQLPSPNGDIYADAMASTLAHALSVVVTNPSGNSWYDRYGLENAAKCQGTFGETYPSANGARANMRLGQRDFLIQQNWVNVRRGYCGLAYP